MFISLCAVIEAIMGHLQKALAHILKNRFHIQLQQRKHKHKKADKALTGTSLIHQLIQMIDFFCGARHEYKISYNKTTRDSRRIPSLFTCNKIEMSSGPSLKSHWSQFFNDSPCVISHFNMLFLHKKVH